MPLVFFVRLHHYLYKVILARTGAPQQLKNVGDGVHLYLRRIGAFVEPVIHVGFYRERMRFAGSFFIFAPPQAVLVCVKRYRSCVVWNLDNFCFRILAVQTRLHNVFKAPAQI